MHLDVLDDLIRLVHHTITFLWPYSCVTGFEIVLLINNDMLSLYHVWPSLFPFPRIVLSLVRSFVLSLIGVTFFLAFLILFEDARMFTLTLKI